MLNLTLKGFMLFLLFVFMWDNGVAQEATKPVKSDTTRKITNEIVLDEILIEGIIEKPNVSILPKRKETHYDEIEFIDRSFEPELKSGPQKLLILDTDFYKVTKIDKQMLKKIILKIKNKY